jgi:TRAP-type C4-dicarboxylate transport system substrate-binding protein
MKTTITILALGACVASYSGPVAAQEVVLKVHHFLPANSAAQTEFIQPWCDRVARASNGKLKCQIYPAMQLGGTPPQLYDQARDGVADVVWTLPGYNAGRFPIVEVFELPFIMQGPEHTSKAVWDYVKQNDQEEFKEVKALAFHVHGAGVFHMMDRPIKTRADLQGTKLRAPTRQTRRFLEILGATPISMPVPQVSEALAKGTINGAVLPYEVVPALKIQDAVKFHSETPASEPAHGRLHFRDEQGEVRFVDIRFEGSHRS